MTQRFHTLTLFFASLVLGGGGLLAFGLFIYFGPPAWIRFDWRPGTALFWDGALSLLFFIQHSSMLRRSVRQRMGRYMAAHSMDAAYGAVSGGLLLLLVVLWQPAAKEIVSLSGWPWWLARGCFFLSMLGMMWTSKSLGSFDPLGISALKAPDAKSPPVPMPLSINGPYRWVRHPFYFFAIVMIWSFPELTLDRLWFNLIWTIWIWIGTLLEERDLIRAYGKTYRDYQQSVPMLFPLTFLKQRDRRL